MNYFKLTFVYENAETMDIGIYETMLAAVREAEYQLSHTGVTHPNGIKIEPIWIDEADDDIPCSEVCPCNSSTCPNGSRYTL